MKWLAVKKLPAFFLGNSLLGQYGRFRLRLGRSQLEIAHATILAYFERQSNYKKKETESISSLQSLIST